MGYWTLTNALGWSLVIGKNHPLITPKSNIRLSMCNFFQRNLEIM
jgi:hypothetical protein